mgnify:CR=1 FL=1
MTQCFVFEHLRKLFYLTVSDERIHHYVVFFLLYWLSHYENFGKWFTISRNIPISVKEQRYTPINIRFRYVQKPM